MTVDLRDIDAFVQVADAGSFTAAASRLYTTQPSLSRRIARLEQAVGGGLFDRSNRRVLRLSPLGEEILPHARQLLAEYERFCHLARDRSEGRDGTVTLAVPVALAPLVLPRLYGVLDRWIPDVWLRVVEIAEASAVSDAILGGQAEIGILNPDLVTRDLESVTFGVVTQFAFGHRALLGPDMEPIEWSDLCRLPLLLSVRASDLRPTCGAASLPTAVVHELGVPSTLVAMAQSGHGVAVLAGYGACSGLSRRPIAVSGALQRIRLQLAWRRRSVLATPVRRLVREIRQRLATREPMALDEEPSPAWGAHAPVRLPTRTGPLSRDASVAPEATTSSSFEYSDRKQTGGC